MRNTLAFNSGGSQSQALGSTKDARLELRTSSEMKDKLRAAAALAGVDMSSYILTLIAPEVNRVLHEERVRLLSEEQWEKVQNVLNSTAEPGERLRSLMNGEQKYERHF